MLVKLSFKELRAIIDAIEEVVNGTPGGSVDPDDYAELWPKLVKISNDYIEAEETRTGVP